MTDTRDAVATTGPAEHNGAGVLALRPDQTWWEPRQVAALKALGIKNASQEDLLVYFHYCQKTRLDPFKKQIYLLERRSWNKEAKQWEYTQTIQVGIDGFRANAQTAATRQGIHIAYEDTIWYDAKGNKHEVWLDRENPPAAARVTIVKVLTDGTRLPIPSVALFEDYADYGTNKEKTERWLRNQWAVMPAHMIEKCYHSESQVLTERGFMRFGDVRDERIVQVTDNGLELVNATPFAQRYDGPMVAHHGERLDFSVTPNHDMITTDGKVEAATMLATSVTYQLRWHIPLTAPGRQEDADVTDSQLRLAGAFLADGTAQGNRLLISVSRPRKVAALTDLGLHYRTQAKRDAGRVSSGIRPITTRHDKTTFVYDKTLLAGTGVSAAKTFDPDSVLRLSQRQAKILLAAWVEFDGHGNRVRTSNPDHVGVIELLAMAAGSTVNVPRKHVSDISDRISYELTISSTRLNAPVRTPVGGNPGITTEPNSDGWVWCVTVPTHKIIVRLNGMAMVSGQCAEAFALRRAFPDDLSGIYVEEELQGPVNEPPPKLKARHREVQPDDDGVIGGKVEDDRPAEPETPAVPPAKESAAKILALFREHGFGGRDAANVRRAVVTGLLHGSNNPVPVTGYVDVSTLTPEAMAHAADAVERFCEVMKGGDVDPQRAITAYADEIMEQVTIAKQEAAEK